MIQIPLTNDPSQTFNIILQGHAYTLKVYFNNRQAAWMLDLTDRFGDSINGVGLLGGHNIFRQYPGGLEQVHMINVSDSTADATAEDLEEGFALVVSTTEEVTTEAGSAL